MQSSLPLLQKNYKFTKVFFWGKLTGTAGDYLIAMGIQESFDNKKFFYWCANTRLGRLQLQRSAQRPRVLSPATRLVLP